ncbi:hypothetical protein R6Q57_004232 [Mikania cordata]
MDMQIKNHWITILRLSYLIGNGSLVETKKYLNKCIYTVGMGNNDYINNYFAPIYYKTSSVYTQTICGSSCRTIFSTTSAGYVGCTPGMMAEFGVNSCVDEVNSAVTLFNSRLNTRLNDLNDKLVDSKFILIDGTLEYPNDINVIDTPCCMVSSTRGKGQCVRNQVPCSNRQNHYFWDAFHPTERISVIAGRNAYETLSVFYASEAIALSKDKETGYVSDA